jgi:mRNA interferase MazF
MGLKQYTVVLVNLDPTIGSEIQKTRPCIIVSPSELNDNLNTIVIVPLTTSMNNYPTRVQIKFEGKEGRIAVDQIRTIDSKRVLKTLGEIKPNEIKNLKEIIKQTYVD